LSLGVDLEPPYAPGLYLSASYWKTDFEQGIAIPPYTNPAIFWGRFNSLIAVNPSAAQIANTLALADVVANAPCAPLPGCIYAILDGRKINVNFRKLDGLDFAARFERPTGFGSIDLNLGVNYLLHNLISPTSDIPFLDFVAANSNRLRLRAAAGARIGALRLAASLNHTGGYRLDPAVGIAPQQSRVGAFNVVNLFARYEFKGRGALDGLALTLNVDNVLDQDPPEFRETNIDPQFSGYANGSTLGRFVRVGIEKNF
jgi:iron complex outermembrane receptor protein